MKSIPFLLATLLFIQVGNNKSSIAAMINRSQDESVLAVGSDNPAQISTGDWQTWRDQALVYANSGKLNEAEIALQKSLNLLTPLKDQSDYDQWQARVLDVQGKIQLLHGDSENALKTWQQTAAVYQKHNDSEHFSQATLNQIQALQNLGYYHQALKQLNQSSTWLNQQSDTPIKVKALQTFGDIAQHLGDFDLAQTKLTEAIAIATQHNYSELLSEIHFSRANLDKAQGGLLAAAQTYQSISEETALGLQSQINLLELLQADSKLSQDLNLTVAQQTTNIVNRLNHLPPNRPVLYARINFSQKLFKEADLPRHLIQEQLTLVYQQAKQLGDRRSQAYALGILGELYLKDQRFTEAKNLSEQALGISQELNAPDLMYQWQWQLGKIQQQTNHRNEAIAAYSEALKNLEAIRGDLVAIRSELQFSFREDIEPVYREFASLLLHDEASQTELQQAREVIEKLQLAELDNFFRDACLDAKPVAIDQIDPHAAIFYTIILGDRLEIVVALPNQILKRYAVQESTSDIKQNVSTAISILTSSPKSRGSRPAPKFDPAPLQKLYQQLIQPIQADLSENDIKTLVFIPDGDLQRLPFGSLYDGEKYLIEQYNVAVAPSLQLIDPNPFQDVRKEKSKVLTAGISKAVDRFDSLPGVENELAQIQQETNAKILLNEDFTESAFSKEIEELPYKVVHIATHGEFSSRLEDTFILTWDDRLNISELQTLLKGDSKQLRPIELLVLSACTTAQGDSRAALGLAGMAVRSGARSTIASLWSVDDAATTVLMGHFYRYLSEGKLTKAEALRQAQRDLLADPQFFHPYYWSAFTLIGNWL